MYKCLGHAGWLCILVLVLEQQPGALQTQASSSWAQMKAKLNLRDLVLVICTGIMSDAESL